MDSDFPKFVQSLNLLPPIFFLYDIESVILETHLSIHLRSSLRLSPKLRYRTRWLLHFVACVWWRIYEGVILLGGKLGRAEARRLVCAREMPPKKTKDAKVLFKALFSNICCFITPDAVPSGHVMQVSQCIMWLARYPNPKQKTKALALRHRKYDWHLKTIEAGVINTN